MLLQEFVTLTKYVPTAEEFEDILNLYHDFEGDKKSFCKAWVALYRHKVNRQLEEKLKMERRMNARTIFENVYNLPDSPIHIKGMASVGLKLLHGLDVMRETGYRSYWFNFDYDLKEDIICSQIQGDLNLYDGFMVLVSSDLNSLEFNISAANKVVDYLVNHKKIVDAYSKTTHVRSRKAA